jgi:hypothetical protein
MKNLRGFLTLYLAAGAALLLLPASSKAQYQPQTFSHPSSFGRAFYYQPYQIPFRMPPGLNYAYVNPSGGTYNYAPRFYQPGAYPSYNYTYQPGAYPSYNYTPFYTNYPPLYVPSITPYAVPSTPSPLRVY